VAEYVGGMFLKKDDTVVSGKLEYRDIQFIFVFDGEELRLIPPKEKVHEIEFEWIMTPLGNGAYTMGDSIKIDVPFLKGICNENGHHYIFLTQVGDSIGSKNATLFINVLGYIEGTSSVNEICKMSFASPEINCIHPVNQVIEYSFNHKEISETGVFTLKTSDFDSTTTTKREFIVDDKKVKVSFGISRGISTKINEPPISINSSMNFEFELTSDYEFIMRLWRIAREFIRFLCYRRNIAWPKVEISTQFEDGKILKVGELHIIGNQQETELDTLKQGRYIKQKYIDGCEGVILSDLAQNSLYTRHIPDSYISGRHIDASRFIMITAAFEWEFHRRYPEGVPKKESTIKVENQAEETIQELIDTSSGKLKSKYQFLKKLIRSDSLQTEVIKMGEDYDSVIGGFGKHLYKMNDEELHYNEMGERIANQRNHFAHGDLDKDFIGASLLDLMYMEYVIYALQLKGYGVSDEDIRKSINELFHLNFAL
jgi:hypothetical protein